MARKERNTAVRGACGLMALAALASFPAVGAGTTQAETKYDRLYGACMDEPGHGAEEVSPAAYNAVMYECAVRAIEVAKQDINRIYASLEAELKTSGREATRAKLERTQRAWITYRDGRCELEGELIGTPAYGLCQLEVTAARVAELESLSQ
jgi:uncharacterized protein YecT (DUF1311 family)